MSWARISWTEAEPNRLAREIEAMQAIAPDLSWDGTIWSGSVPAWPFDRTPPEGLDAVLGGRTLQLAILYPEGFPMVAPRFLPLDPEPDIFVRTDHEWHVNGDGTLCLFQAASQWDPAMTAADLIPKASGWFLEYILLDSKQIEKMTLNGIVNDSQLDPLLRSP